MGNSTPTLIVWSLAPTAVVSRNVGTTVPTGNSKEVIDVCSYRYSDCLYRSSAFGHRQRLFEFRYGPTPTGPRLVPGSVVASPQTIGAGTTQGSPETMRFVTILFWQRPMTVHIDYLYLWIVNSNYINQN